MIVYVQDDQNLCNLLMLKDTFSLEVAHIIKFFYETYESDFQDNKNEQKKKNPMKLIEYPS